MSLIDYSVEFLHVYSNETFDDEHITGAVQANKALAELPSSSVDTILLVDNYNPSKKEFDLDEFIAQAASHGINIDHIAFEADLVPFYEEVLELINNRRFRMCYERYVEAHQIIPCSFLTATWYLLRLGLLTPKENTIISRNGKTFKPATQLLNILPQRFDVTENKAISIIKRTKYKTALDRITNIYHESPKTHHPSVSSIEL